MPFSLDGQRNDKWCVCVFGFYFEAVLPNGELSLHTSSKVTKPYENERTGYLLAYYFILKESYHCCY